jgi:hypothetical protein
MERERRLNETPPAPTKKLSTNDTSDTSPDTAVLLGRLETILNRILGSLGHHAPIGGAVR